MATEGRWAGRTPAKDQLRNRVWATLQESGLGIGPVVSNIPTSSAPMLRRGGWRRLPLGNPRAM